MWADSQNSPELLGTAPAALKLIILSGPHPLASISDSSRKLELCILGEAQGSSSEVSGHKTIWLERQIKDFIEWLYHC